MLKNTSSVGVLFLFFKALRKIIRVTTQVKFYVEFLATVGDDVDDECLLLYYQVALLADFKSAFSRLNFVGLGLASLTLNIEPEVFNAIRDRKVVLFL